MSTVADLLLSAIALAALYALIGVGFSLSFNIGRFFDLSLGASFLVAGYVAYALSIWLGLPLPASMLIGVGAGALFSALMGLWLIGPLSRRVTSLDLFIATLAILYVTQALVGISFGEAAHVLRAGAAPTFVLGYVHVTDMQGGEILVAAVGLCAVLLGMHGLRWGRYARAVSDDRSLSARYGIPVTQTLLQCYVLAGVLAGVAGVFYAADRVLEPGQAMAALLAAMVATIIGGETVGGALIGALLLAVLQTAAGFSLAGNWKNTVAFTILLIFLSVRRGGAVIRVNRRI